VDFHGEGLERRGRNVRDGLRNTERKSQKQQLMRRKNKLTKEASCTDTSRGEGGEGKEEMVTPIPAAVKRTQKFGPKNQDAMKEDNKKKTITSP